MIACVALLAFFPAAAQDDTTPPTVSEAWIVDGQDITLKFSEPMFAVLPAVTTFTVEVDDEAADFAYGTPPADGLDNEFLNLRLDSAASDTQTVTVSYAKGDDENPLQDVPGNELDDFTDQALTRVARPTVSSVAFVSAPAAGQNDTYKIGDVIQLRVTFDAAVDVVGSPLMVITFGGIGTGMTFDTSGSTTNITTLDFNYTVVASDNAPQGITIGENDLEANRGVTIRKHGTNVDANLDHTEVPADSDHKIDGTRPALTANPLAVSSTPAASGIYEEDEHIEFTATFGESMTVTTTGNPVVGPRVTFTLGSATKNAVYHSGSGGTEIVFRYTAAAGDVDTDGISVGANALSLNGGAITDLAGNAPVNLNHSQLGRLSGHRVDTTDIPKVSSVALVSTPPTGQNDTYTLGDTVRARVTFSSEVDVVGSPVLKLQFDPEFGEKSMTFDTSESTTNTTTLDFTYTVVSPNESTQGIAFYANMLSVGPGVTIREHGTTQDAFLDFAKVDHDSGHKVDTNAPTMVEGQKLMPSSTPAANSIYTIGEHIEFTALFNENVTVTTAGDPVVGPRFSFTLGTATKTAVYHSGSGTTQVVFRYTVAAGDDDADGILMPAGSLDLNGATITDLAGNALVDLTYGRRELPGHKVDALAPTVAATNGLRVTSTPATGGFYRNLNTIDLTVKFTENVTVTTAGNPVTGPHLPFTLGTTTRNAVYHSGSGGTDLVFRYTVADGEEDKDGISVGTDALALNGATITDAVGNAAVLDHSAGGPFTGHKVDAAKPEFVRLARVASNTRLIHLHFNEELSGSAAATEFTITVAGVIKGVGTTGIDTDDATLLIIVMNEGIAVDTGFELTYQGGGTFADLAGNKLARFTHTHTAEAPTVAITGVPSEINTTTAFTVTFTFSEDVTGFATSGVTVTGGTKGNFTGSGSTYSLGVTPSGNVDVTVTVAADAATAGTGLTGPEAAVSATATWNSTAPSVAITGVPSDISSTTSFTATFTFSESVTGFTAADVTVTNGTGSGFSGSGTTYMMDVTPDGDADVTVTVVANAASNGDGDTGPPADVSATAVWDTSAPTLTITGVPEYVTSTDDLTVTFTFSKTVTGFEASDVTVTNGTMGAVSGSGGTYTATVTPDGAGNLKVEVAVNSVSDSAGTTGPAAAVSATGIYDATAPTVSIRGMPEWISQATRFPPYLTIGFSETVTGFERSDLNVTGGSIIYFDLIGATWDVEVQLDGEVDLTVEVPAGAATDAAGNPNVAASVTAKWDSTAPTVSSATVDGTSLVITFSEDLAAAANLANSAFSVKKTSGGTESPANLSSTAPAISDDTVTLTLAAAVVATDTDVKVTYTKPASGTGNKLVDPAGNETDGFTDQAVTNNTNSPATGAPAISGFAQVEQTLTAGTDAIMDADGLTSPTYSYQWIRVDGSTESDIAGATSSTYTLVAADQAKTIKVKVTFQDDNSISEVLTSDATAAVVAAARDCTTGNAWCATLTVAEEPAPGGSGAAKGYCSSVTNICATAYGTLSDTTFTLDGTNYTVKSVRWGSAHAQNQGNKLHLTLDQDFPAAGLARLTLKVTSHELVLSDAARGNNKGNVSNNYQWARPSITNDDVGLQMTVELLQAADTTAPTISIAPSVTSDAGSDNTYAIGDTISVKVTFDENVTVAGTPQLEIAVGDNDRQADYASGSGSTELTFSYTVVADDTDADGISVAANKLTLNGGTIKDAADNNASLAHTALTAQSSHKVDGVVPTVSSATVDGTSLEIEFSETLGAASSLPNSAFTVEKTSGGTESTVTLSSTAPLISDDTVTLTLAEAVVDTDTDVKVTYAKPASGTDNKLVDAVGNEADGFTDQAVTNSSNRAPVFDETTLTRSIAENTAADTNVGAAIEEANDADNDTLTYTMEGTDAASFTFDASARQIKTKTGVTYDFETKSSYSVTIKADDSNGGTDTVDVTINLANVEEPPDAPGAPTVSAASATSLSVSWTAPTNTGASAITDYDLRYFAGTSDPASEADWIEEGETAGHSHSGTATMATITGLTASTAYRVQVRAAGDGEGAWSSSGSATTSAASAPTISTISIASAPSHDADSDNTADTYIRGEKIAIDVTYNEPVTITGGLANVRLRLDLGSDDTNLGNSRKVIGIASQRDNNATLRFEYTVLASDADTDGIWVQTASASDNKVLFLVNSATITSTSSSLAANLDKSGLQTSGYSNHKVDGSIQTATPPTHTVPSFDDGTTKTLSIEENNADAATVGTVAATDSDGDTLTYSLTSSGTDHSSFTIDSSGNIKVATGVTLDHEGKVSYSVTAQVTDGEDSDGNTETTATIDDTIAVTISVTDANEPPDAPDAPTVAATSGSTTSLDVSWAAPDTTGKPAITDYDVRYFKGSADPATESEWIEADDTGGLDHVGTGTTASITGLDTASAYRVQVRATNAEGTGGWSTSGGGSTNSPANSSPSFSASTLTRSIAENTAAGANVGAVIPVATDSDGDTLTYSMEGTDAASFNFNVSTRQITTKTGVTLDHEAKSSYSVTIKADDGNGGTDTVAVTISVTDESEPPDAPTAPTVAGASSTSVTVTWTAPDMSGKPAISDYDVQFKTSTASSWTAHTFTSTNTSTTISSLSPNTSYNVQIKAHNAEGESSWSATGTGSTNNTPPSFASTQPTTASVNENSAAGTAVVTVVATDPDAGDTLTYSLDSASDALFNISSSGAITVQANDSLNHEVTSSITATVTATDSQSATATRDVDITINDVAEPPTAPTISSVSGASTSSVTVVWSAPTNTGKPAISDYDVRYFKGSSDPTNATDWIEPGETDGHDHSGTATTTTITGLDGNRDYRVQVLATNDEGSSAWSTASGGKTNNNAPSFASASVNRSFAENTAADTNVGAVIPEADEDDGDSLTYTIEGTDETSFSFDASARQIKTKTGVTYDFETKSSYSVTIKASDGIDTDTIDVTISVTDVNEPPAAPTAPTVAATSGSTTSLDVSWTAPGNTGKPAITDYDVQFKTSDATTWTLHPLGDPDDPTTTTSTTISSLVAGTSYQVQIKAKNDEGESGWSTFGSARTNNTPPQFTSPPSSLSIAENSDGGTSVGTVAATDADAGHTLTYSLDGTSDAVFNIDANGAITVQNNADLNHEGTSSYATTVTVSDGRTDGVVTHNVTINVTDVDEPASTPAAPSVSVASTTSLSVSWTAPDNTGKPDLNDYDVQYKQTTASDWTAHPLGDPDDPTTTTSTTISSLTAGTSYQVQVKAANPEGASGWSPSGSARTTNTRPQFTSPPSTLSIAENSAGGSSVGTVAATDADAGHTLSYSLDGTSDAVFNIDANGAITVQSGADLNHEGTSSYAATVTVTDSHDLNGDGVATHNVTINVADVNEPPGDPTALSVTGTTNTTTSLTVTWTAPDMTGKPPISDYDIRHRLTGDTAWTDSSYDGTAATATITNLVAGTGYDVQVLARNDEGDSSWSAIQNGLTNNTPPTFTSPPSTLSLAENSAGATSVGSVPATDADLHPLTYELGGAAAALFSIDGTGAITLQSDAAVDHEDTASYAATVTVSDNRPNGNGTIVHSFTINVDDVDEPPTAPTSPTVIAVAESETSVEVSWTAPDVTGKPPLTGYDVRYYRGTAEPISDVAWVLETDSGGHTHTGTGTTTTITGLFGGFTYLVQITATNDEGTSPWSSSGSGTTNTGTNTAPTFDSPPTSFDIAEDSAGGVTLGTVTASDEDGDAVSYALDSASDEVFDISSTGVISLHDDAELDFEATPSYTVTVIANDGTVSASHNVTVNVTDVNEPPAAPTAPTVTSVSSSSIEVTWQEPDVSDKPPITDYDLRYFKGSTAPTDPADWIEPGEDGGFDHDGSTTTATIPGLDPDSTYQVQVLARSTEGVSDWSATGSGATNPPEIAPTVERVQIVSAPPSGQGSTYKPGDTLSAQLSFNNPVDVIGFPILKANFGAAIGQRDMLFDPTGGRINVRNLNFNYDIEEGVLAAEGVSFDENALQVPEGSAIRATGQTVEANLNSEPVEPDTNQKVDGTPPVLVDEPAIRVSSFAGIDDAYGIGDHLEITAEFNEAVNVTAADGAATGPQIAFTLGVETKQASYHRTDGERVIFRYTVVEGDEDTDSIDIASNGLMLNGASITDLLGNTATAVDLEHAASSTSGHNVDGIRPTVATATANGSILRVEFAESLDSLSAPPPSRVFTVIASDGSTSRTISGSDDLVLVNDVLVTATLAAEVANGETATLSYVVPTSGAFEDLVGNAGRAFSQQAVTNRTPRPGENTAPIFTRRPRSLDVPENSAAGTIVGLVTATDDEGDEVNFALDATTDLSFDIDAEGTLSVQPGAVLDHENTPTFRATIMIDDGVAFTTHDVTILVTDVLEPPAMPDSPIVTSTTSDNLEVVWTASDVQGIPAITDYDVRYRAASMTDWIDASFDGTETTTTIAELEENTTYVVQIRATNDEGTSDWSASGSATTLRVSNVAPEFDAATPVDIELAENSDGGSMVGTVLVTDADGDKLTYSLDTASASVFLIDAYGVITLQSDAVLDFEVMTSHAIVVSVADGFVTVTHRLTVKITDEDEPPIAPAAPTLTDLSETSLKVDWIAPDAAGKPAVSDYDVRYREQGRARWVDAMFDGIDTSATLTELKADSSYQVQVRATNDEGTSDWSEIGTGMTSPPPNRAPTFTPSVPDALTLAENSPGGTRVGRVTAADVDGDTLSYALDSAVEGLFEIDGNGVVTLHSDATLDFESVSSYEITVTVSDGKADATHALTITVADVDEPPDAPAAPTLTSDSPTGFAVTWVAPDTTGKPAIIDYDIRHRESRATVWTDVPFDGTATNATVEGVIAKRTYLVQVRATNAEGTSPWSDAGSVNTLNSAPVFTSPPDSLDIEENSRGGTTVGTVLATDADGDALTYSLDPASAAVFSIDAYGVIALRVNAELDFETTPRFDVTVTVTDGVEEVRHQLTINVTDIDEVPGKPAAPTLSTPGSNPMSSLAVQWQAPDNLGSPISDYDVRYRVVGAMNWQDAMVTGTATSSVITPLIAGTIYEVQVRASNADGTGEWSDSAMHKVLGATISDAAPITEAWLARFGRVVTDEVSDAIATRHAGRGASAQSNVALAGQSLASLAPTAGDGFDDFGESIGVLFADDQQSITAHVFDDRYPGHGRSFAMPGGLLSNSSFMYSTNVAGTRPGVAAFWGRGGVVRFDSRVGGLNVGGAVRTGLVATDFSSRTDTDSNGSRWTVGLALGHAMGAGDYRDSGGMGDLETQLTGLFPYGTLQLGDRISVWTTAGVGAGELTVKPEGHTPLTADVDLTFGALGLRSEIRQRGTSGGLSLAIKGDARFSQTASDEASSSVIRLAPVESATWLARLGIETAGNVTFGDGSTLSPMLEIALRLDGGDAEDGHGADVSGGFTFADSRNTTRFDVRARHLLMHQDEEFSEWGASASFTWDPNPASTQGLAMTLKQSLGMTSTGGMDALFSRNVLAGFGASNGAASRGGMNQLSNLAESFDGELSYGLNAMGAGINSEPYIGFGLSDFARDWRAGWRFISTEESRNGLMLNVDFTRREPIDTLMPPLFSVMLRGAINF